MDPMTLMMLLGGGGGGQGGGGLASMAGGLLGGITGLFQRHKAKKMLESLHRPEYVVPAEVLKSQKMAEMSANEGLPSQQYNQAMQNIQRQQNRALSASSDRRGGLMSLPALQQQANDSLLNLDVSNANAKLQNQKTLYGVSGQTAAYRDKAFNINQMQPYQEKYNYAQSLLGAGNQNALGGADKFLGGLLGSSGGQGGLFGGGSKRKMTAGNASDPTYYNGYNSGSDYSTFETGY